MQLIKWAGIGSAVGVGIAVVLIPLVEIRPFPVAVNSFLERATFKLCPLFVLGFSSEVRSIAGVIVVTILGNAILYGLIFSLLAGIASLFRRGAA
jgi:hypothetical protein